MTIKEFMERTGHFPSVEEYSAIEKEYMSFDGDKDEFCKMYRDNIDGFAEMIQCRVDWANINRKAGQLRKEAQLMREIRELRARIEQELDWKPYEDKENVSQSEYAKLAAGAEVGNCSRYMTDEEAKKWICDEFDFDPEKVKIIHDIDELEVNRHREVRKTGRKIDRRPVYCATDYYYIRFYTNLGCYEAWNGDLRKFYH